MEDNTDYKSFKNKIKTLMNRSQIADVLTLAFVLALTIVLSILSVGWDIMKISWNTYAVNLSFLLFLGIFGLFYGEKNGRSFFKNYIAGAYQFAKELFTAIREKIINKNYADSLPDYIIYRYKKDYQIECKKLLVSVKVFDERYLELPSAEFEKTKNEPIMSEFYHENPYFDKLSPKQYELVEKIRAGEVELDYIDDANFFLMHDINGSGEKLVTRIKNSEKRKRKIENRQRRSKLILIVLFSAVGAGIFVDQMTGQGAGQTWLNLLTRLTTLLTSIIAGFNTARLLNHIDVEVLDYKTTFLEVFFSSMLNGSYTPTNYQEVAKQNYEKHQKEVEESKNNVVEPEILEIEDKTIYQ